MIETFRLYSGPKLLNTIIFEIRSWIGRKFEKNKGRIRPQNRTILLDLGFGNNYTKDWLNADFYKFPRIKFWKKYEKRTKPDLQLDFRFPIDCPDNAIDGVYSGHTLEHLYPKQAIVFLEEIYRILKPSCWLRIVVPDLQQYINFYVEKTVNPQFYEKFKYGCEAINYLTQKHGHHTVWDEQFLLYVFSKIGFRNVRKVKFGEEGVDKSLIKEEEIRCWESIVIEAQKP